MPPTIDRNDLFEIESRGNAPIGKLPPVSWMATDEILNLFAALDANGAEARFVGGCVRDALAKRPVHDVDIATTSLPETVMALLKHAGIRVIPTGIEHGTVTAIIGSQQYQITTLREDVATDGRRATVAYTEDWFADARRRDFTINAMTATLDGDVYDPYNGIADLAHGRIRFIGKALDRIAEDHLRILRFFRFQATHGRPPADKEALSACRKTADKLTTLSGERVQGEMRRILGTLGIPDTLLMMRGEGVLQQILPETTEIGRLRGLVWLTTRAIKLDTVSMDWLRNLAAALPPQPAGSVVEEISERWKLSGKDQTRLKQITTPLDLEPDASSRSIEKYLYIHGAELVRDRALLQWATEVGMEARLPTQRTAAWTSLLERTEEWDPSTIPTFPLNGEHVLSYGIEPGPQVGDVLSQVKEWWCDGGFSADLEECLRNLEKTIQAYEQQREGNR